MVSHGNIVANTNSIISALGLLETDRMMVVLPFHYCFGASLLHTYLKVGAMLVLDNRFAYPEVVLQRMQETECTGFAGVPSHYQILLRNSSLATRKFPSLRSLLQAGGHLAPSFLRELQEALPGARIFVMYGQTEATARLSCLSPEMVALRPDSVGKAIPGVKLRVTKNSGEEALPGEVGEITAEGDNIAQGYWHCAAETDDSFRDGKLYTGDLATVDADGYLYIVDRAKDFLKRGATRVSIKHIEDRILECRELLEVAVVGVPDEVLGEAIRAFVVSRSLDDAECEKCLRSYCKTNLPASLHPRDIIMVRALPKNSSGKVLREKLKNMQVGSSEDGLNIFITRTS
jgi:acyl-CoA synthetase (AMP-forming)/AMP-acid ligase II